MFYYCDHADKRTLEPAMIFGTLTRQLLEKVEPLPENLASIIEKLEHDGEQLTSSEKVLELLLQAIQIHPHLIYFVLDGLDEASEKSQKTVHQGLDKCLTASSTVLKLLLTGREELKSQLSIPTSVAYHRVLISQKAIGPDIECYVRASTQCRISNGSLVIQDRMLEDIIVSELVKGAKGM